MSQKTSEIQESENHGSVLTVLSLKLKVHHSGGGYAESSQTDATLVVVRSACLADHRAFLICPDLSMLSHWNLSCYVT